MQEVEMIIDKPRELVIESAISDKPGRPLITKYLAGPRGSRVIIVERKVSGMRGHLSSGQNFRTRSADCYIIAVREACVFTPARGKQMIIG